MKNILFILIACLMVTLVKAAPAAQPGQFSKRDVMVKLYAQQKHNAEMGEKFLEAVKKGDAQTISELERDANSPVYLMATDKFGNNAFHLAKDPSTIQAVARSIRNLYKKDFPGKIRDLKNQPNHSGVIPAVQAIFDFRPENFFILLKQSDFEGIILKTKSLNKGGAISAAVGVEKEKVVNYVQLAEGFTAVDFARNNQNVEGMDKVVAYFAEYTPYL